MHKLIFRVLKFPTAVGKVLKHLCCVFICKLERQSNDLHLLQLSVTVYLLIKEGVPEKSCRSLLIWRKKKKENQKSVPLAYQLLAHVCQPNKGITSLYWCWKTSSQ